MEVEGVELELVEVEVVGEVGRMVEVVEGA